MPRAAREEVDRRRQQLLGLLADGPVAFEQLRGALSPVPSVRTLRDDLAWLAESFPGRLRRRREPTTAGGHAVHYTWVGALPVHLDPPIEWALQEELTGLVLSRAMLAGLAGGSHIGVGRLLDHPNLRGLADVVARDAVQISAFGTEPADPQLISVCLAATLTRQGLHLVYHGLAGSGNVVHIAPQRMVLVRNEWYCIAWGGRLRTYRCSRMQSAVLVDTDPPGMPAHIPTEEVDALLEPAFFATASNRPEDLVEVVLAVSPTTWRQVHRRTWGMDQSIEEEPTDLPEGWRRLRFTTAGLMECKHWVLSMGAGVRAEAPDHLVDWLRDQARNLQYLYAVSAQLRL